MPASSVSEQHALKNGLPTIAVLVGSMTSSYQEGIMLGVNHVAEKKGYNVIGFCGGVLNSSDPLTLAREDVFNLVDMDLISGVISPFSAHTHLLDEQATQEFIGQFSSVPTINIGSHIDSCTNILTDYETGFSELFEHLYHVHGRRNIVFLRGPKNHASSDKRMEIYKKLLLKYDLPFDPDLVIYGHLNGSTTEKINKEFLEKNTKPFDAAIAINDNQAIGFIDLLRESGLRVPEDIAVIGSMDTLEGAFASPALTSIHEPLFALGRAAALELIEQLEGKPPSEDIYIPTTLMVRKSCGCDSALYHKTDKTLKKEVEVALNQDDDLIFKETESYIGNLVKRYKGGIIRTEVAALLTEYQEAIYTKEFELFLTNLQLRLEESLKSEDIMLWLALTSKLKLSTLRYLEIDNDKAPLIALMTRLIELKNDMEQVAIKFQRFESEYYLNYFRTVVNNLNSTFDLAGIKKYTVDVLQLSDLYISIFQDINAESVVANNIVSVRHNETFEIENKNFVANKLLPDAIEPYQKRFTLMVFPLSFRKMPFGFMVINLSNRKGTAFESLRAIISSALKNETLIQDLTNAEKRFSDIAHSTSNWLWETDVNNQFTYCSDSANYIIGYSPSYLVGKKLNEFNINDGCLDNILTHENLIDVECWCRHYDGSIICLLVSAKPIVNDGVFCGYRGVFEDITEQRKQENKIKNLAYSDTLTGLANRTAFQDKLTETIAASEKNKSKFALMFIDLDHFKNINDSMGHGAGDLLLIKLAGRLNQSIRSNDMVARLGGDEFIIILPDIEHRYEVEMVVERIFTNIKQPIIIHDKPVYSALSLGISLYPSDGEDAQSLLTKGDNAMYQAKSQGRNGYAFYDKSLEEKNALRNKCEDVLREALATEGFVLHYQPQVSAQTGKIVGFEALVRIINKTKGLVSPNHFIPLAEELGLIGQIDEWVFEEACSRHAIWRDKGLASARLSINLSALQLRNDSVLDVYIEIIERYNIAPKDIQLEITENTLIENEHTALKILQGFKEYGVSIALDDFGTGYSSLNCISLYPIDTIKIDRSFVKDAVDNPKHKAIIEGIVLIASSLDLNIIAEGVETEEQYEFIKKLGCHEIQGYYFHKPCSEEDAEALLEKNK
ncbi:EAL domain-containing protein [Psychromonas algicola]|uniref:EAL domain-containing protein n=1 Tax=Psychromonas algicola TaxID=2555642 RepID=UPI001067A802|nr:EAL domain-containing protein [Psychromonas sp. RZ5]TEW45335.1 EAL domain-containing protein [Psychromonas sp. RZ5]